MAVQTHSRVPLALPVWDSAVYHIQLLWTSGAILRSALEYRPCASAKWVIASFAFPIMEAKYICAAHPAR